MSCKSNDQFNVCPKCGYCPCCGRSNTPPKIFIYPQPYTTPYIGTTPYTITWSTISGTGSGNSATSS